MSKSCKVSLCMIVKDETACLARCLASVKDMVDEIIVVDTGSTDSTVKIAHNYGARVFNFAWEGDFSKARNYSLEQAKGDWIIYLDADEELLINDKEMFQELLTKDKVDGYYFTIISPTGDHPGGQQLRSISLRLFKNNPTYRFQGAIHEQIIPSILANNPAAKLAKSNINILHHGYKPHTIEGKNKNRRNLEIVKKQVEQDPGNNFYRYNLGVALYQINDLSGAIKEWQRAMETLDYTTGYAPTLFRNYIICLILTNQHREALQTVEKGISLYPDYTDLYYLKGQALEKLMKYPQAEEAYKRCLELGESPAHYVSNAGISGYLTLNRLANLMETCKRYEEAVMYYCQAFSSFPKEQNVLSDLLRNLQKIFDDPKEIRQYIDDNISTGNDNHLFQLATTFYKLGDYEGSLIYLEKCSHMTDDITLLKAKSLIKLGHWDEAKECFLTIKPGSPIFTEAILESCICNWSKDNPEDSKVLIEKLPDIDRKLYLTLLNFNNKITGVTCSFDNIDTESLSKLVIKLVENGKIMLAQEAVNLSGELSAGDIHFNLGKILFSKNMILEAADQLLRAMHAGVSNDELYYMLGCVCHHRNVLWDAEQLLQQSIAMNPNRQEYHEKLVEILISQTCTTLSEAITKFPHNPLFRDILSAIRECQQQLAATGGLN